VMSNAAIYRSSAGRTRLAPEWPSSSNTHCSGTSRPSRSACARSAAVCDPIVSCSFCRAEETRARVETRKTRTRPMPVAPTSGVVSEGVTFLPLVTGL